MTSSEIRQSFLDFFKSKQHTIVPSSSLMPDSPNLLFTNAGMNQFVPIFLGQVKCPYNPPRAADTQKCIRAGGKHNDLDDVGLDTYHHTFFEMLGNWSFGDYFKKEAIDWAWELITEVWKFPKNRLYATVYSPDRAKGDPSEFDQEAYDFWAAKFNAAGLDPKVHIVFGNKKDNFWMMGETGPCGPCSELHVDLTPAGDTKGSLVNKGDARCMEIWNLVFIQFNANPDGTFSPLPAKHVDTGMGFERASSIIQCTKRFTDFTGIISNYETDIFRPIFDAIEKLSRKKYGSTLPKTGSTGDTDQEKTDVAFRVIADHIRTLSFAIADGIQPGNTDRNYVLRRILRRAVLFGRKLNFTSPFLFQIVSVLVKIMGDFFPEILQQQKKIETVIKAEEEMFFRRLVEGEDLFFMEQVTVNAAKDIARNMSDPNLERKISGDFAFKLHDTYGFPIEETERMAREHGLSVDLARYEVLREEQRARARAAQKREVVSISQFEGFDATKFIGFESLQAKSKIVLMRGHEGRPFVVLPITPFYAEMGGQVGDSGVLRQGDQQWHISDTRKNGNVFMHFLDSSPGPKENEECVVTIDVIRRNAIQRHHTVTHLMHWALHEIVSKEASQKGSFVGPDKLTFDFNSAALTPAQVSDIEKLVNERILENAGVSWMEIAHADVKNRKDVMQFFGDKYGDKVRVVQIGGGAGELNGYSMELCGGTHTRATGEIGLFCIVGESAVAAGVRRIEAVAGLQAYQKTKHDAELIGAVAGKVNAPVAELEKKIDALLAQQKELEKSLRAAKQKEASGDAKTLLAKAETINGIPAIITNVSNADGDTLQTIADALKSQFKGVIVLGGAANGAVSLVAAVSAEFTAKVQAGKIIQGIAPIVGGKGGGKPDNARGGGKDVSKLDEALAKAKSLLG